MCFYSSFYHVHLLGRACQQAHFGRSIWDFPPALPQEQCLQQHHVLCGTGRRSRDSLTTDPGPASVAPLISWRNQILGAHSSSSRARAVKIQIHTAPAGCFTVQSGAKGKYFLTAQAEPFSFSFNTQDNASLASKPPISCAAALRGILQRQQGACGFPFLLKGEKGWIPEKSSAHLRMSD